MVSHTLYSVAAAAKVSALTEGNIKLPFTKMEGQNSRDM